MILNTRPPSEMVQSVIGDVHILSGIQMQDFRHMTFNADWHITDIENTGIRAQLSCRLRYDCGRIGIVQHPCLR